MPHNYNGPANFFDLNFFFFFGKGSVSDLQFGVLFMKIHALLEHHQRKDIKHLQLRLESWTFIFSQTFYDVGLFWVGSIGNSMIVLVCGCTTGKTSLSVYFKR